VLAPEIFTRARHWPRLASAHHKLGGGLPKNFKGKHLKFGLKFNVLTPITLRVVVITSRNLLGDVALAGVITWTLILERVPNKIWEGQKRLKFSAIFDNFQL